jgi:hypothetical protein
VITVPLKQRRVNTMGGVNDGHIRAWYRRNGFVYTVLGDTAIAISGIGGKIQPFYELRYNDLRAHFPLLVLSVRA